MHAHFFEPGAVVLRRLAFKLNWLLGFDLYEVAGPVGEQEEQDQEHEVEVLEGVHRPPVQVAD